VLWDAATGEVLRVFKGHKGAVGSCTFSPGGGRVTTTSTDSTVRVWDVASGREIVALIAMDEGTDWVALTPEGVYDGSPGAISKVTLRTRRTGRVLSWEEKLRYHQPQHAQEALREA
jgi:WD40 repeat protein